MLYARKTIGGVSPKNTFLLTTYANTLPALPLQARRLLMAGARANTLLFCSARTMRNLTTSFESTLFVLGDFYPGHSEEVAGGKYFALVKPNADGVPIPNAGEPLLTPM